MTRRARTPAEQKLSFESMRLWLERTQDQRAAARAGRVAERQRQVLKEARESEREQRERLAPLITNRRYVGKNPAFYENFEYLAVICRQFKKRHPSGTYPQRLGRMPVVDVWPEALR